MTDRRLRPDSETRNPDISLLADMLVACGEEEFRCGSGEWKLKFKELKIKN